jgi:HSP20 family protein
MTRVHFKRQPATRPFNNLMGDLFPHFPSLFRDDASAAFPVNAVPVNVKETPAGFELEVVAPGLEKEDFKIQLDEKLLTIEAQRKETEEKKEEKSIRSEYRFRSFKRSFTVDESIDATAISAKYVNGVLTLNLPKKESVKEGSKQITIE